MGTVSKEGLVLETTLQLIDKSGGGVTVKDIRAEIDCSYNTVILHLAKFEEVLRYEVGPNGERFYYRREL
jgi:hypothetical protein